MVTFENKGLTLTNASFMCNKAKDKKTEAESLLNSISFVNTSMAVIGSETRNPSSYGLTDITKIQSALDVIAEMNGFIAYFAEGRKAVEEYKKKALGVRLEDWCKENDLELPVVPVQKKVTMSTLDDVLADMSIGDKVKYLQLEAIASSYGKYLHNDGQVAYARKQMHNKVAKPIDTTNNGRDTLFSYYEASIEPSVVDKEFTRLNDLYREAERKLNKMKSDLREALRIRNAEETVLQNKYNDDYDRGLAEYNLKYDTIRNKYQQYLKDEEARLSNLKIEIPEKYMGLVAEWSKKAE